MSNGMKGSECGAVHTNGGAGRPRDVRAASLSRDVTLHAARPRPEIEQPPRYHTRASATTSVLFRAIGAAVFLST